MDSTSLMVNRYRFAVPAAWQDPQSVHSEMAVEAPYIWRDGRVLAPTALAWSEAQLKDQEWSCHTAEAFMAEQVPLDHEGREGECIFAVRRDVYDVLVELGMKLPSVPMCDAFPRVKLFFLTWDRMRAHFVDWYPELLSHLKQEIANQPGAGAEGLERARKVAKLLSRVLCFYEAEARPFSTSFYPLVVVSLSEACQDGREYQLLLLTVTLDLWTSDEEVMCRVRAFIESCKEPPAAPSP